MLTNTPVVPGKAMLSLQMLVDQMEEQFWDFAPSLGGDRPILRGCSVYCGQKELHDELVYILPEGTADFPVDRYRFLASDDISGMAPHVSRIDQPMVQILNLTMEAFRRYREFELQLCTICNTGGSLQDLCTVGSVFFNNPLYIHDDMFAVLAYTRRFAGMMKFEYNPQSGKVHLPLWLINDFKFDINYQRTFEKHSAAIWGTEHNAGPTRSLYVNLWDGSHYRGRLLIGEIVSSFQPGQFAAAEVLAYYAMQLIRRDEKYHIHPYHDFEDTFLELVETGTADPKDLRILLDILDWEENDRYLCIQLRSQKTPTVILSDGALSGQLSASLRKFYSFTRNRMLYIVVNQTRASQSSATVRQLLASYVRDSYMHGGISNSVQGLRQLCHGFRQTQFILDHIQATGSGTWLMLYQDCALDHLNSTMLRELPREVLAAPTLLRLRQLDRENGTEYYNTLKVYLTLERNIPRTAQELIIHRTTLSYRLKKIEELVSLNLEDPKQRLYLLWSFSLLEENGE